MAGVIPISAVDTAVFFQYQAGALYMRKPASILGL